MSVTEVQADRGLERRAPPARRPRWTPGTVLALLAVVAGVVACLQAYRQTYQPLQAGGGGYFGLRSGVRLDPLTDGLTTTAYIMRGRPGQVAEIPMTLSSDGSHPVTVLGVTGPLGVPGVTTRWSTTAVQVTRREQRAPLFADTHALPAHLPAHGQIDLWLSVPRPGCLHGEVFGLGPVQVRWKAFAFEHTTQLPVAPFGTVTPVQLCWPATALAHIGSTP